MKNRSADFWLFTLTIMLLAIGIFMVFNASYARAGQSGDSFTYLKRQVIFAAIGLVFMLLMMNIRYWKFKPFGFAFLGLSIIGLILVFVPGIGAEIKGASRWIRLTGTFGIQPSEFAKLGLIIFMAGFLAKRGREIRNLQWDFIVAWIPFLMLGALIMKQPDMGTAIVFAVTTGFMIYLAGARKRHIISAAIIGIIVGIVFSFSADYRSQRMTSFIDPFQDYYHSGYQLSQSLIALGSGGIRGVGLCEGREKLFYLPEEHTDFIFAIIGEETGLIGTLVVSSMFLAFGLLGFRIAFRTRDNYGKLLAGGISVMICGQALLNMLVVTGSVPTTGVPLPFLSYGGSSLIVTLMNAGLLLGISKYPTAGRG